MSALNSGPFIGQAAADMPAVPSGLLEYAAKINNNRAVRLQHNNIEEETQLATTFSPEFETATYTKVAKRLIPFLFICYIVAFLDRVNVGFAKLQMAPDLNFSDTIYGFGAGIFFIGYSSSKSPATSSSRGSAPGSGLRGS